MWADGFEIEVNLEFSINKYVSKLDGDFIYKSINKVEFKDIKLLLDEYIFYRLPNIGNNSYKKELAWHFIEYYGLISTALNEKGVFNPLAQNQETIYLVNIESSFYKKSAYYIVQIEDYVVITAMGIKKQA
ncbi:MAG: hypothetical protein R3F53_25185 [Gammaproteobacteria bacterium]